MSAAAIETAKLLDVAQITDGAQTCEIPGCERDAVLVVTTEPDAEPGVVCAPHGVEWIDLIADTARGLFRRQFSDDA
jgi:hypothetical protein